MMATIRLAQRQDLPDLLQLYTYLGDNPIPALDDKLMRLWQTLLNDPQTAIIVAESQGHVVSTCTLTIIRNLTHDQRPCGIIENVVTGSAVSVSGLRPEGLGGSGADRLRESLLQSAADNGLQAGRYAAFLS